MKRDFIVCGPVIPIVLVALTFIFLLIVNHLGTQ